MFSFYKSHLPHIIFLMNTFEIKKLTPALAKDCFDFFDKGLAKLRPLFVLKLLPTIVEKELPLCSCSVYEKETLTLANCNHFISLNQFFEAAGGICRTGTGQAFYSQPVRLFIFFCASFFPEGEGGFSCAEDAFNF